MTFLALYRLERRGLLDLPTVGVAGSDVTVAQLGVLVRKSLDEAGESGSRSRIGDRDIRRRFLFNLTAWPVRRHNHRRRRPRQV